MFNDRVGDEALIAIGRGCPLQHLNVSGCHQIGDLGIIAIARGCPQLTYLDVSVLQVYFSPNACVCICLHDSIRYILIVHCY